MIQIKESMFATALILMALAGLLFGIVIGDKLTADPIRREGVQKGYALYCPQDGKWAWQGECKEAVQ